ncbi:exported hypothetical protein [uncultured Desulfobacterium sp.]|uniref:Uncharacterized protein n=1 Tax=uncultured Desulfobacterium sp. TaxID=201089 RepID=A0A445MWM3_9BACT|nr:exported hypothetical protein [uncultured Desulfobacterium sp.]
MILRLTTFFLFSVVKSCKSIPDSTISMSAPGVTSTCSLSLMTEPLRVKVHLTQLGTTGLPSLSRNEHGITPVDCSSKITAVDIATPYEKMISGFFAENSISGLSGVRNVIFTFPLARGQIRTSPLSMVISPVSSVTPSAMIYHARN